MEPDLLILSEALKASGWLPPDIPSPWQIPATHGDLLPALRAAWRVSSSSSKSRSRAKPAEEPVTWLDVDLAQNAQLTHAIPGVDETAQQSWLGVRIVWWPRGMPRGRRVGLVSSRLGRELHRRSAWFAAFRSACAQLDGRRDVLVTATGTAAARFVQRAASLSQVLKRYFRSCESCQTVSSGDFQNRDHVT